MTIPLEELRSVLKSQYHASLAMLRETVDRCSDDLWISTKPHNAFWQVAYHTLYFTHLYLQPNLDAFRPWKEHQADVQNPDGIGDEPEPSSTLPLIPNPYSKSQVLDYWSICDEMVDSSVDSLDLLSPESGFFWYKVSKFEHQLISIRHVQHHAAQLADRLRQAASVGTKWVGAQRTR